MIDDKDPALADAIRSGADAIRVPWTPLRRRRQVARHFVAFASVLAILVGGVLVGGALNARRQSAVALPSPATRAALAPDASRLLVVNLGGQGIGLRTETDPAPFFRVSGRAMLSYAVSADGKLAYWKTGPNDALPHELHVYDTANRSDKSVLTLTTERGGASGFMVWSTDGTGLALSVSDADSAFEGPRAPRRPTVSSWRLLDVGTGVSRTIATASDAWIVPISWDRRTDVATATDAGRDGPGKPTRDLYVFDQARVKDKASLLQLPAAINPFTVRTDSGARVALGLAPGACGQSQCAALWTWPIEDPPQAEQRGTADRYTLAANFRPGTTDVFTLVRCVCDRTLVAPDQTVEDWGPLGAVAPRVVMHQVMGGFFFRSDGSALVFSPSDLNARRGLLVDPDTGTSVPLPLDDDAIASLAPRAASVAPTAPSAAVQPGATSLSGRVIRLVANGVVIDAAGREAEVRLTSVVEVWKETTVPASALEVGDDLVVDGVAGSPFVAVHVYANIGRIDGVIRAIDQTGMLVDVQLRGGGSTPTRIDFSPYVEYGAPGAYLPLTRADLVVGRTISAVTYRPQTGPPRATRIW